MLMLAVVDERDMCKKPRAMRKCDESSTSRYWLKGVSSSSLMASVPRNSLQLQHQAIRQFSTTRILPASKDLPTPPSHLPHLAQSGAAHMIPIHEKAVTHRFARASGVVIFSTRAPLPLIRDSTLKKGDVLALARIAGIMAAKRTSELIPLCHPISLSAVEIELELLPVDESPHEPRFGGVKIEVKVECDGKTGVEMESLTAVMGAALTLVDMVKSVDRGVSIENVRVVEKTGGRSGWWKDGVLVQGEEDSG
jgi:molybdenum cofactor biosynthesis protein MoaC